MRYVPALDGLRAVAILGVLLFHILPGALPGGFTGVDVFFVLSGYLIASVILHDLRARRFSMREFYLRRIQRLLPNAVVMVGVTVVLSTFVFLPSFVTQVAEHGLWTLANLSNLFIVQNFGGYWQDVATATPLLHTWSLAVEEQFYLVLPVTLWLLARPALLRRPRAQSRAALAALCGLATASYLLALAGTWTHPVPTFYLLPARAWEPLLGAALAVWRVPVSVGLPLRDTVPASARQHEIVGWAGLTMIVAAYFVLREGEDFPGWIALLPTVGTLAVLFALGERPDRAPEASAATGVGRLLARPSLVGIGKLSYSLYLWHWPLLVFARTWCEWNGYSPELGTWIGAGLGILLAGLAYAAIERPLRRRGPGRRRRLLVLAAAFVLCAAATLAVARRPPARNLEALQRYFDPPENAAQLYNSAGAGSPRWSIDAAKYAGVVMPSAEENSAPSWQSGGIVHAWGPGSPRVVVLGSSHALAWGSLIDDICRRLGLPVAFLSRQASRVFFDGDPVFAEFDAARRRWLEAWRPDLVIVIDRWDLGHAPSAAPASQPSQPSYPSDPSETAIRFDRQLRELVRELTPHTRRILLFSQVPVLALGDRVNLREYVTWKLTRAGARGTLPTPPTLPAIAADALEPLRREQLATLQEVAKEHPALRLLRADAPFYLPDGSIRYASGRTFYYLDDNHLSTEGTELLREPLTQAIQEALPQDR
jgi:peptidoglycan/LPS O-acetylase OafA/YrhL